MGKADLAAWDCLPDDIVAECLDLLCDLNDYDETADESAFRLAHMLIQRDIRAALIARQFGAHGVADAIMGYNNGYAAMKKAFTVVATGPFDPKAPPIYASTLEAGSDSHPPVDPR